MSLGAPLVRVDTRAIVPVATLLARAFQDDPEMVAALPDAARRAHTLPFLIGLNVRYGCLFGEVYATREMDGTAIWLPPGMTAYTLPHMARAGMLAAPLRLEWRTLGRLNTMGQSAARLHQHSAPMPHWYLAQVGVEPSRQGCGVGSGLLRAMLTRIDAEGSWCYLETANPANLGFYQRRGFRVAGESEAHTGGPRLWGMLRAPGGDG